MDHQACVEKVQQRWEPVGSYGREEESMYQREAIQTKEETFGKHSIWLMPDRLL